MNDINVLHHACAIMVIAGVCLTHPARVLGTEPLIDGKIVTKVVAFGQLDLSNPEGARALYQRIKRAARAVCQTDGLKSVERQRRARICYEQVVTDAVNEVRQPLVDAAHASATAKSIRKRG
jgi:UrcA family protein